VVLRHRACILLTAAALAGCFESDEPLITVADSAPPLPEGEYVAVQFGAALDGAEAGRVIVVHDGAAMRFIANSEPETKPALSIPLGDGFYVLMPYEPSDESFEYLLGHAAGSRFTFYDQSHYCNRLRELWLQDGTTPEKVGISEIRGDGLSTCRFARYEDLARAFRALIADGRLEPLLVIEPATED